MGRRGHSLCKSESGVEAEKEKEHGSAAGDISVGVADGFFGGC